MKSMPDSHQYSCLIRRLRDEDYAFSDHSLLSINARTIAGIAYICKHCYSTRSRPTLLPNSCWAHSSHFLTLGLLGPKPKNIRSDFAPFPLLFPPPLLSSPLLQRGNPWFAPKFLKSYSANHPNCLQDEQ